MICGSGPAAARSAGRVNGGSDTGGSDGGSAPAAAWWRRDADADVAQPPGRVVVVDGVGRARAGARSRSRNRTSPRCVRSPPPEVPGVDAEWASTARGAVSTGAAVGRARAGAAVRGWGRSMPRCDDDRRHAALHRIGQRTGHGEPAEAHEGGDAARPRGSAARTSRAADERAPRPRRGRRRRYRSIPTSMRAASAALGAGAGDGGVRST